MIWEKLDSETWRMWIPQGWIVKVMSNWGTYMVIINDEKHNWELKK